MQGSTGESHTQIHIALILLRVALWDACEFSSPSPSHAGDTGGSSGLAHCLPEASLAALLCFVHINIKHAFQLDLFHPRRQQVAVTPSLSHASSQSLQWSILLGAGSTPGSSLEPSLWRDGCTPASCGEQLFSWQIFCVQCKYLMLRVSQ